MTAEWTAREGEEGRVEAALRELAQLTREEPGCVMYRVHRSVDVPQKFLLYEEYEDHAAYEHHLASEHFDRLALNRGIPLLESRVRAFYERLGI